MARTDCLFCEDVVPFTQHEMAYYVFELTDVENRWRLCRNCAEVRTEGEMFTGYGHAGASSDCIDCDETAAYGITLLKETPAGDIVPDDDVYHVFCEEHLEERRA
ncbi:hypothetical protein [Natronolimnohabitans innermongolicus]|uniref:Uncharacterized protein n=1 Tax=Natronolimnohabitans innermongolicus JCM 12255 TaxID=1227499 RepID=L9X7L3_9EURY|nr:hypothetical protein [Natronolimnohabitans innermongolicus]ELY57715.1 hypothetical protein C493_07484 [Natronolimnohabitans innermongolicus JCM 12255]